MPLHPNNPHHGRYDFVKLVAALPALQAYLVDNPKGDQSIDFNDAEAVKCLNQALLAQFYGVKFWQIPQGYLCPPIPGRADYICYLAQFIEDNGFTANKGVRALDIGTGASCIYPIIGSALYNWRFVASDINPISINVAQTIVDSNKNLKGKIKLRLQSCEQDIFNGLIKLNDNFTITMCNPPFHESAEAATASNQRKVRNLANHKGKKQPELKEKVISKNLNFGGQNAELWCVGGELAFIQTMIKQSVDFAGQVKWFSSLVSKKANLPALKMALQQVKAKQVKVIKMSQGQKISHILLWGF